MSNVEVDTKPTELTVNKIICLYSYLFIIYVFITFFLNDK